MMRYFIQLILALAVLFGSFFYLIILPSHIFFAADTTALIKALIYLIFVGICTYYLFKHTKFKAFAIVLGLGGILILAHTIFYLVCSIL